MKKMLLLSTLLLSACADAPESADPHAEFNRDMHNFNMAVDTNILRPVSEGYNECLPDAARESIASVLSNLKEPYYFLNYVVSCDPEKAANSLFRFVINTVFGVCGLADIGSHIGLEKADTSYKDTLKKLEIGTGDYIVLPIFGPSSTRDTAGEVASWFCDPVGYVIGLPIMVAKAALTAISDRAENAESLNKIIDESMDLYSVMKSTYFQKYGIKSESELKKGLEDTPSPDDDE